MLPFHVTLSDSCNLLARAQFPSCKMGTQGVSDIIKYIRIGKELEMGPGTAAPPALRLDLRGGCGLGQHFADGLS